MRKQAPAAVLRLRFPMHRVLSADDHDATTVARARSARYSASVHLGDAEGRRYTLLRRGGRAVECGGLENRYVGKPGIGGSNPPLSAPGGLSVLSLSDPFLFGARIV